MAKAVFVTGERQIDIPDGVADFDSFRRWLHSGDFPEKGRVCYINGTIWADLSVEAFFDHGQVKAEIGAVLHLLVKNSRFGRFAPDGTRYSHPDTQLSTEPDGMVISTGAFAERRVELVSGSKGGNTEVVGVPDIVIEIVSPSSVDKDTEWLTAAYHDIGIPEYWLIDARDEDDIRFDIYRHGKAGYKASRKQDSWVKSPALSKSFRLVQVEDESGNPEFTLEVR